MSAKQNFQNKSYNLHAENFKEFSKGSVKERLAKTWLEKDTVDAWRHARMYRNLDPILTDEPHAKWLTVGDGRYGRDAKYILDKGGHALPTDISETLLKEAKDADYIHDYSVENAESLSFGDSEFDYVLCKESYHHFPRPTIGLYEMLRVASKGVFLIEPNDIYAAYDLPKMVARSAKNMLKRLLGKKSANHVFEIAGNYVYTLSRREIEKVALGLNYKVVAFKGLNDTYLAGGEYEKLSDNGPLQRKVRNTLGLKDLLARLGFQDPGMLIAIIFKQTPSKNLCDSLAEEGFLIINLPENPYISD